MTIALWCVLAASLLPYIWGALSKSTKNFDNAQPRSQQKSGWRQRADWAQQNSWEAFAPFAVAVLIAHGLHVAQPTIDWLAGLFILLRVAYGIAYILNQATLRSLVWVGGFGCLLGLYIAAARVA